MFTMLHRQRVDGMYPENVKQVIWCDKTKVIWSKCIDGAWTPPLSCTGSNNISLQN